MTKRAPKPKAAAAPPRPAAPDLAHVLAVAAMCAPGGALGLAPIVMLVPLYAQRTGSTIEAVYAREAGPLFDELVSAFAAVISEDLRAAAMAALDAATAALDPDRMRQRLLA